LPGISGIIDLDGKYEKEEKIIQMLNLMKYEFHVSYRPEYKVEHFHQKPIALGRASLEIIDPHPQPVFNRDRSLCLVMCGEVYHYQDDFVQTIKKDHGMESDNHPQLILYLLENKGTEVIKRLNGSFALALWDFKRNVLTIANDRYGLRPLYYFWRDSLFAFASEMKSILTFREVKKEIDNQALAELFSFNFILGDKTLFKHIKMLNPASILTFKDGTLKIEEYWEPMVGESETRFDQKGAIEKAHTLLLQAVKRQMDDRKPTGCYLSGGLDSRTLLGAVDQLGYKIPTFTYGRVGCDDQKGAELISSTLGMQNYFFEVSPNYLRDWLSPGVWITEGMTRVAVEGLECLPEIRKEATVLFNGFGGNDLMGHLSFGLLKFVFRGKSKEEMSGFFDKVNEPFSEELLSKLFLPSYYPQIKERAFQSFTDLLTSYPEKSFYNKIYHFFIREKARKSLLYGLLVDSGMIEYKAPFYDYDLVDFLLTIPPKQRMLAILYRKLISNKFPNLAKIPYQRTGLPVNSNLAWMLFKKAQDICQRKLSSTAVDKRGHIDDESWMRNELKDFVVFTLLSKKATERGFFNPEFIKEIVNQHLLGTQNNALKIGTLLTFELWNQLFIDGAV
jgi:asparagine synthase (glutamine-hydrolysing)